MTEKVLALLESQEFDFGGFEDFKEELIDMLIEQDQLEIIELSVDSKEEMFEFQGYGFLVLTDEEADELYENYEMSSIEDMGLELFSKDFQETILNQFSDLSWFDEYMQESYESYVEDIHNEGNRLQEELDSSGCEDDDEYVEYLCAQWDNGAEWYKFNMGESEFNKVASKYADIDWQDVIDEVRSVDGRGSVLASYDGYEMEECIDDTTYYIYRVS